VSDDETIVYPKFGDPPISIGPDDPKIATCFHNFLYIQQNAERVVCRSCKKVIAPFEVVRRWARTWEHATWLDQQISERQQQLDALKEEEQRVKARLRSGKKGIRPELIDAHFDELLARLAAVQTQTDLWEVERWRTGFNWFTQEQAAALKVATVTAKRRIEDTRSQKGRSRRVRVIEGGGK